MENQLQPRWASSALPSSRSSCFLEEMPGILTATVVAGMEAEGPSAELSILKQ